MNPDDYAFDENSTMKITTIDTIYNFNGVDYHLLNDTLFGKVSKKLDKKTTLIYNVEIPLENIESVELEGIDVLPTVLITLGVVVGVLGLLILLFADVSLGGGPSSPPHGL